MLASVVSSRSPCCARRCSRRVKGAFHCAKGALAPVFRRPHEQDGGVQKVCTW